MFSSWEFLLLHNELALLPYFFSIVYVTKLGRTASHLNSRNIMYEITTSWEKDSPLAEEICLGIDTSIEY